jgi:hypothetical protein
MPINADLWPGGRVGGSFTIHANSAADLKEGLALVESLKRLPVVLVPKRPPAGWLPAGWKAVKVDGGWVLEKKP